MSSLRVTVTALSLALATSACAITSVETSGPTEPVTEVETLDPSAPPSRAEARIAGRLVDRGPGRIAVDVVRVLFGQEAVDAAHEDGELPPEEDSLPNDVYIDDLGVQEQHDVAEDATTELIDCATGGCQLATFDTATFLSGELDPPYGGEHPVLELDLDAVGVVVAIREVYLP